MVQVNSSLVEIVQLGGMPCTNFSNEIISFFYRTAIAAVIAFQQKDMVITCCLAVQKVSVCGHTRIPNVTQKAQV